MIAMMLVAAVMMMMLMIMIIMMMMMIMMILRVVIVIVLRQNQKPHALIHVHQALCTSTAAAGEGWVRVNLWLAAMKTTAIATA
jgi:hypothetical protein